MASSTALTASKTQHNDGEANLSACRACPFGNGFCAHLTQCALQIKHPRSGNEEDAVDDDRFPAVDARSRWW